MRKLKPNRNKYKKSFSLKTCCNGCDRYLIHVGVKCPYCGFQEIRRKKADLISLSKYKEDLDLID